MSERLHYRLTRRGIEITSEVICQKHYDMAKHEGQSMGPLSVREIAAGYKQTAVPYTGDRECESCAQAAEERATA